MTFPPPPLDEVPLLPLFLLLLLGRAPRKSDSRVDEKWEEEEEGGIFWVRLSLSFLFLPFLVFFLSEFCLGAPRGAAGAQNAGLRWMIFFFFFGGVFLFACRILAGDAVLTPCLRRCAEAFSLETGGALYITLWGRPPTIDQGEEKDVQSWAEQANDADSSSRGEQAHPSFSFSWHCASFFRLREGRE